MAAPDSVMTTITVSGMTWGHCVASVTEELCEIAGAAMALSSVAVVTNSLQLRRFR